MLRKLEPRMQPVLFTEPTEHETDVRSPSSAALQHARACLEAQLAELEDWRALRQLEARETAGEWFDVVESDVLRDRLTVTLSAAPEFMAWQFVDAAIGCLQAGDQAARAMSHDMAAVGIIGGFEPPASAVTGPAPVAAYEVVPDIVADRDAPIAVTPLMPVDLLPATAVVASHPPRAVPLRELATRIPTLLAHDGRDVQRRLVAALLTKDELGPGRTDGELGLVAVTSRRPDFSDRETDTSPEEPTTRFDATAASIEEADVHIVRMEPSAPLLDARLPPLPLTDRIAAPGARLPRSSRSTTVKWAEPATLEQDDFRPIGSALDEAQVTIIDTVAKSEAEKRAERRALGVAPDRENQMRRFLKALSGE